MRHSEYSGHVQYQKWQELSLISYVKDGPQRDREIAASPQNNLREDRAIFSAHTKGGVNFIALLFQSTKRSTDNNFREQAAWLIIITAQTTTGPDEERTTSVHLPKTDHSSPNQLASGAC